MLTITSIDEAKDREGTEIGVSDWHTVTQEDINTFAEVTGDTYFIHTDPEKAKDTPFGGTIAHGYYTLSLGPKLSHTLVTYEGFAFGVNYGTNKVRFPAPLPVGDRVRMRMKLARVEEIPGGAQITTEQTFEREGSEKPVCVVESLTRVYAGPTS
jgi:acyl dehydratase